MLVEDDKVNNNNKLTLDIHYELADHIIKVLHEATEYLS